LFSAVRRRLKVPGLNRSIDMTEHTVHYYISSLTTNVVDNALNLLKC
jgi:hypothetical protein